MKAYKFYDLHSHVVFHSREVVFHEDIFPFSSKVLISSPSYSCPLPLPSHDLLSTSPLISSSNCPSQSQPILSPSSSPSSPSTSSFPLSSSLPPSLRHTTRSRRPPPWLQDCVTNCSITSPSICPYIHPTHFSSSYLHCDPTSYGQASLYLKWRLDML